MLAKTVSIAAPAPAAFMKFAAKNEAARPEGCLAEANARRQRRRAEHSDQQWRKQRDEGARRQPKPGLSAREGWRISAVQARGSEEQTATGRLFAPVYED